MSDILLGLDIGTTGCKAVLVRPDGTVLAEETSEYPLHTPRPGWTEQEPEDWWQASIRSIRRVLESSAIRPGAIAGIGLTGQMHGLVLLDGAGRPLRRCIMWNDQRTAGQCREITERVGRSRLIELTGKPALTGFTAGKVLWVRDNEPELYTRVATLQLPKDYVRFRLTGARAMDVADASGTNLLDVGRRRWSDELTEQLSIPRSWLPELYECATVCGQISNEAAHQTGLAAGTPVVAGAGDQAAQAVGTGIIGPGTVSVTIGTSGVVFAATDDYRPDPEGRLHAYCHAAPNRWHLMGVTLAAGGSLRWYRDTFADAEKAQAATGGRDVYDLLTAAASAVAPGSDGLLFLPYLSGERSPYPDPNARGVFFGLSLAHTRAHLVRAVIEGVSFSLRDNLELLCGFTGADRPFCSYPGRVRISGGGARSAFWRQVLADVFGFEVVEVNITQGACYGAALLAGVGTGIYPDVAAACAQTIHETGVTRPGPDRAVYERRYPRYRALYPALRDEFARNADGDR